MERTEQQESPDASLTEAPTAPAGHNDQGQLDVTDYSARQHQGSRVSKRSGNDQRVYRSTGPADFTISSTGSSITPSTSPRRLLAAEVNVTIHIDGSVTVIDNGAAFPSIVTSGKSAAEVMLMLHAGSKFEQRLQGVGRSAALVCLSSTRCRETLDPDPARNGEVHQQSYERGIDCRSAVTGTTKRRGTKGSPSNRMRRSRIDHLYSFDTLAQRLRELAFLNGGIVITLEDERDGKNHRFHYDGGIVSFVQHLNKNKAVVNDQADLHARRERRHRRRNRHAVERQLRRADVFVHEQHQHARRRQCTSQGSAQR